jgi:hypothetical protein
MIGKITNIKWSKHDVAWLSIVVLLGAGKSGMGYAQQLLWDCGHANSVQSSRSVATHYFCLARLERWYICIVEENDIDFPCGVSMRANFL